MRVEPPPFRLEEQLLLWCVKDGSSNHATISELLGFPLNWDYVLKIAHRHRVLPLVYWRLKTFSTEQVPAQVLERMRSDFRENALHNLMMLNELKSLLRLLGNVGIAVIPFKGVFLALQAYDHNALRMIRDIDLIVPHEDVHRAKDRLLENGYRIHEEYLGSDDNPLFEQHAHTFSLVNRTNGMQIELHWRFMPGVRIDTDHFWHRALPGQIDGIEALQLPPEDLLLLLLIHGSKHLWSELIWSADIDALLRRMEGIPWNHLLALSQAWGVGRFVRTGALFCHTLLNSPIPEAILHQCRQDRVAVQLCARARRRLFTTQSVNALDELSDYHADFQMRDSWNTKLHYLQSLLTNWKPSPRDIAFLHLPHRLYFLYPIIRPVRALVQYSGAFVRSRKRSGRDLK